MSSYRLLPWLQSELASAVSLRLGISACVLSLPVAVLPRQTQFGQGEGFSVYPKSLNPGVT